MREQAHEWLVLLTSGRATAADADALRAWRAHSTAHAQAFAQAKALWRNLGTAAIQVPAARISRRALLGGAVAASVAVWIAGQALPSGLSGLDADFRTRVGEQREVQLATGVTLELNTETRLNQQVTAAGQQDIELLQGEIQVLVSAPTNVRVQAGGTWMAAQNARFMVRLLDGAACVSCLEGAVQVQLGGGQHSVRPGQTLTYRGDEVLTSGTFDPVVTAAWTHSMLVFNDMPLAEVVAEINRYRPGRLVLINSRLGQRKVQARLRLDQLDSFAALIRQSYGATCTELPGGVIIIS
nr:FecR domain-containing protein [Pseudomonas sp. BSw22131]